MSSSATEELREVVLLPKRGFAWFVAEIVYMCRVLISSGDRFYWDNGFSRAASLAYTTLFSLVPVVTLCLGFFASFHSLQMYLGGVTPFILKQFLPHTRSAAEVAEKINEFAQTVRSLNVVTIPFLVFTAVMLINSIEYALNQVWQVFEARTIAHRIAIYCAILVIGPILAISTYYTSERVYPFIQSAGYLTTTYNLLLPFLIDFIAFVSLYYLVPKAPVQFRAASFGAFFAALLFDVAKEAFAVYIRSFSSYDELYGTLAAIPIFLFWLYLAWAIVLFGAEVSYQAQYLPRTGKLWKRTLMSVGDGRLVLAVQALIIISRAFLEGRRLPNDLEIAEKLGCSSVLLKPALDALKKADIIARGDSHDMPLALKRSPDRITLGEIHTALFQSGMSVHFPAEMRSVFDAFDAGQDPSKVTLVDVVAGRNRHAASDEISS
jgi:membrane protein